MSRQKEHPASKVVDRVVAEETTTLPEGAVLSVYCMRQGKLGHTIMKLVAMHSNMKRVEMTVDKISPHNMRRYLELVRLDIERRRKLLTEKPAMNQVKPDNMIEFVLSMAFNDMFIFEVLTNTIDADKPEPTKKVVSRRRKAKKLSQVLPDSDGTVRGSGETQTDC